MRKTISSIIAIVTIVLVASSFILAFSADTLVADSNVILTLNASSEEVHAGDVVTINVMASELNHITRFGPIDLSYNRDFVEFISIWPTTEMSSFTYTADSSVDGHLLISAVDQAVEADISANQMSGEGEDNSVYFDSEVVLFSVSFRMNTNAVGDVRFWIDSASGFRDSSMNDVGTSIGDGITISVSPTVSDDASLTGLSVDGITLTPEFDPSVFEYTCSVSSDIEDLNVSASAGNLWASISITGDSNLQFGENNVYIDVVAQDQTTTNRYTIYATRQSNEVVEGSGFYDAFGKIFTFVDFPSEYVVPDGFIETTRSINGYNVPVFARDGVSSVILYLYDGTSEPAFYFYNPSSKIVTRFNNENYTIMTSRILSVVSVPEIVRIPDGFFESDMSINGVTFSGYSNSDGVFIAYMRDEEGNADFYRYNEETGRFVDYKSVDRTSERIYSLLFVIFVTIAIIEAIAIIVIVCVVRGVVLNRMRPKPKRV